MFEMNYFQVLCLFWAIIGIGSRIIMITLGEHWNRWELEKAYGKEKPKWIYLVGILGILLIIYTWYSVFALQVAHSWIIASLISLTAIKIFMLLFRYGKFRAFIIEILNNKNKLTLLNSGVAVFSLICIAMALFLY